MPKILSPSQIERYKRDGVAFPVPVLDANEVRGLRAGLHGHFLPEQRLGTAMSPQAQAAVRLFRLRQNQGFKQAAE